MTRRIAAKRKRTPEVSAFPVVGVGASAGGLEALQLFIGNVPPDSRAAFVVVQHLDPTHAGLLSEILQRSTALVVAEAKDNTRVVGRRVYVIPPNKDMTVKGGVVHLTPPLGPRGRRLPIDSLFGSLAEDFGKRSVGVLLSGMGSDGTKGLLAIRARGGTAFVQDPTSAKFDMMPRSAIDAGAADVVDTPEELARKIGEPVARDAQVQSDAVSPAHRKIVGLLRSITGHDFSLYKRSTIDRRIERRMSVHHLTTLGDYLVYLKDNPGEVRLLFDELLIGVTSFHRDAGRWEQLKGVLSNLLESSPKGTALRAWVVACSTGEEAYSLAMIFREALDAAAPGEDITLQIFATDLDESAIDRARKGVYGKSITADVSPARLRRFFVADDDGWRVKKEIRDSIVFAKQNVLQDPPFTKLDLLTCRNVLIYLTSELQQKLLPIFHYSLKPTGFLFLGSAETVGNFTDLFVQLDGKSGIYRRFASIAGAPTPELPIGGDHPALGPLRASGSNLQALVERRLLQDFAPAAVLATNQGDVLYVSGKTGRYLELPSGKANWNVFALAREGLRHALASAFHKVASTRRPLTVPNLTVGESHVVDLLLEPVDEPVGTLGAVLVVFRAVPASKVSLASPKPAKGQRRPRSQVEAELGQAHAELHALREEMQTSQEDLRSANEELQSTNEELQSTNEELTTSKEEMQSMNEELRTLNHELQAKVDELSQKRSDMRNLLDSTEIAILFLDGELNVRRFTPQAASLIKLIPTDIGRPFADLATNLDYPELDADARAVLKARVVKERVAKGRDGRRYSVRILPYRTVDNRVDGLVITFQGVLVSPGLERPVAKGKARR